MRTGIEAFNLGDYVGTVEHFEAALPLAEEQDDGSTMASQLIEAVRYYADGLAIVFEQVYDGVSTPVRNGSLVRGDRDPGTGTVTHRTRPGAGGMPDGSRVTPWRTLPPAMPRCSAPDLGGVL